MNTIMFAFYSKQTLFLFIITLIIFKYLISFNLAIAMKPYLA